MLDARHPSDHDDRICSDEQVARILKSMMSDAICDVVGELCTNGAQIQLEPTQNSECEWDRKVACMESNCISRMSVACVHEHRVHTQHGTVKFIHSALVFMRRVRARAAVARLALKCYGAPATSDHML
ncbi:unnamed protein product [Sphagnum balticum]